MKIIKGFFDFIIGLLILVVLCIIAAFFFHQICNNKFEEDLKIPGDKIEIYDGEKIHSVLMGNGYYTIVMLPGMGTASPYYDYYNLATSLAEKNQVLVVEPLGYGFSDNTDKARTLDNYELELSKVLDYYRINNNIILLGHSYSGISNLNYANKHNEVKGLICLDCTSAYQIETHVKDGKFTEEEPKTSKYFSYVSTLGISRVAFSTVLRSMQNELLEDVPEEYHDTYKYLLYNKTLNKTIINEINDIYSNQLKLFENKYRDNLFVSAFLSDETIEEMKQYKKDGDFYHDWEEMHNLIISNSDIQKIYTIKGNHYIHHNNTKEISDKINEMISRMN